MTEEEKRRIALEFLKTEQNRTSVPASIFDNHTVIDRHLAQTEKKRQRLAGLAQQGITVNDLKAAYDEAFNRGQDEMIYFRLTFFYASTAIAVHEAHPDFTAEQVGEFMKALYKAPGESPDRHELVQRAISLTGVDTSVYDIPGTVTGFGRSAMSESDHYSRKDYQAAARMQKKGISAKDLEYEKKVGYSNGWHSSFFASACYAGLALTLHAAFHSTASQIEEFIDRVIELGDEEISVADILARCVRETGVDVSRMAKEPGLSS